jgi:putative hydrolase of the HAD superfamily
MKRYLIWDFDGTLAYRLGGWTGALLEVIRREGRACEATAEQLRPIFKPAFPGMRPSNLIRPSPLPTSGGPP